MAKRTQKHGLLKVAGIGGLAVLLLGAGLQLASADDEASTAPVSVVCPTVAGKLGTVPAAAQDGVDRELQNLENQIANVNERLAREPGQAGNQLNDIAGKRRAVLDRISQNITRVGGTAPAGLAGLATCAINGPGGVVEAGHEVGNAAGTQTVNCPTVEDQLPEVPAEAAGQVERELAALEKQIAEANSRLARLAERPEGGPNFVRNAIVGPLEDKRVAVLNRIATAIGRVTGDRPGELVALAPCTVDGAGQAGDDAGAGDGDAGQGSGAGNARR